MNTNDEQVLETISVFTYLNSIFLSLLPFFGLLYSLVWSFKPKVDKNRKNLARAMLILQILFIIILVVLFLYVWNSIVKPLTRTLNAGIPVYTSNSNSDIKETLNQVKNYDDIDIFQYFNGL